MGACVVRHIKLTGDHKDNHTMLQLHCDYN